eukprot:Em0016g454a
MSRLAVLFRNAHAIAKAGRPFTDMEWMCALDEKKGLDVGAFYKTDKKCCEFIHYIAEEQRVGLQQKLQSNNFFSIMVDGTTDSSNLVLKAKQEEALFHLYNGRDVFAWFPTGYGKSICFQLVPFLLDFKLNRTTVPQVERSVVLVISPLVSLMVDQPSQSG